MCAPMNKAEDRARDFLSRYIELVPVDPATIKHGFYDKGRLENCSVFMFHFPSSQGVGAGKYLAVPNDAHEPFYLGEIGE